MSKTAINSKKPQISLKDSGKILAFNEVGFTYRELAERYIGCAIENTQRSFECLVKTAFVYIYSWNISSLYEKYMNHIPCN